MKKHQGPIIALVGAALAAALLVAGASANSAAAGPGENVQPPQVQRTITGWD